MSRLRWPWLTLAVFAVAGAVITVQTLWPPLIELWRWDATRVGQGEIWRLVTGALVHTNGTSQIVLNLLGLLAIGWFVEQHWSRPAWFAAFAAGVLTAELFGTLWYPVGGGLSVGLGGLVGLTIAGWVLDPRVPWLVRGPVVLLYLAGAAVVTFKMDIHGPPVITGALVGMVLGGQRRNLGLLRHG